MTRILTSKHAYEINSICHASIIDIYDKIIIIYEFIKCYFIENLVQIKEKIIELMTNIEDKICDSLQI